MCQRHARSAQFVAYLASLKELSLGRVAAYVDVERKCRHEEPRGEHVLGYDAD